MEGLWDEFLAARWVIGGSASPLGRERNVITSTPEIGYERHMASHRHHHALDSAGLTLSAICMVHCLLLPLAAALLPAAGSLFDEATNHRIHWLLLGFALPISGLALWRGGRRIGSWRWLMLGALGLCLMTLGIALPNSAAREEVATLIGVVLLALAHLGNWFDPRRQRV
jgi:hypothetical protein